MPYKRKKKKEGIYADLKKLFANYSRLILG